MSSSRKVKQLLKKLQVTQADDATLTAPVVFEIKLSLKYSHKCQQVVIVNNTPFHQTFTYLLGLLPFFLRSQLEGQNIPANTFSPSTQVFTALNFALHHLSNDPWAEESSPTLFFWQNPDTHRTNFLFAYINVSMESRVYTVSELLGLREAQSSQDLLDKLKQNSDLDSAEIVKGNSNNTHNNNNNTTTTTQLRRGKKSKDDVMSSTDSEDHVIFQGKKQPRAVPNSEGDSKNRSRAEAERPSTEPLPAPTGLAAQQSEGFQRFFKAVVSPTHVRVTAGGRIVPNTRPSPSPTAKWDKDRPAADDNKADMDKQASSEAIPGNGTNGVHIMAPMMTPHMAASMYPGFHPMISAMGAPVPFYPGMPFAYGFPPVLSPAMPNMGMPQNSAPQNAAPQNAAPQNSGAEDQKHDREGSAESDKAESGQEGKKPKPAPITISPPEQFDQTRPFYHNGHVFYPPGSSGGPFPGQMTPLTSPYLPAGFAPARASSFAQPSPVPSIISPSGIAPTLYGLPLSASAASTQGSINTQASVNNQGSVNAQGAVDTQATSQITSQTAVPQTAESGTKPPITSIKPSEITKGHLNSLRSSLKYYEDQLQYNKHQIDEKWTQNRVTQLHQLIGNFEHNYQMQLKFEASYYPKQEKASRIENLTASESAPCQTPSRASSMKVNPQENNSQVGSIKSVNRNSMPALSHAQSVDQLRPRSSRTRIQRPGINSSKGVNTSDALEALEYEWNSTRNNALPSGAAMAPPFEPRTAPLMSQLQTDGHPGQFTSTHPDIWANLGLPTQFISAGGAAQVTGFPSQRAVTTPYLVGKLPQGMSPHIARSTDYQYSRELTEEEKRARHIYWGQVPNKGFGLPKFDGKDFYPPSPVKEADKMEHPKRRGLIPVGRPTIVPMNYSTELPETENDPFRNKDSESIRSNKTGNKVSRAVPIVDPETLKRHDVEAISKSANGTDSQSHVRRPSPQEWENMMSMATRAVKGSPDEKKSTMLSRRAAERSSTKSGNDLLQNMLKKGQTSGTAATSAVSSTTATGYLPQYFGHAAASLSPAIANGNGPSTRTPPGLATKPAEQESFAPKPQMEKTGENLPPDEGHEDRLAELRQQLFRDAERRGDIGPGWQ